MLADETVSATLISKQHQILAENSDPLFWFCLAQLFCRRDDMPIAPKESARWSSRPDAGKEFVFFLTQHGGKLLIFAET
jgi:hypothetical protein